MKGRERHILADTEGFVPRAKIQSAKVMDHEGIKTLLQKDVGWSVDLVERPKESPLPKGC